MIHFTFQKASQERRRRRRHERVEQRVRGGRECFTVESVYRVWQEGWGACVCFYICVCVCCRTLCALFHFIFVSWPKKIKTKTVKNEKKNKQKSKLGRSTNSSPATLSLCFFRPVREAGEQGKREGGRVGEGQL